MAEEKVFTKKDRPENIEGEFVIPEGFTEIEESAFSGCSNLTSVVIPNSITKIGKWAFAGCGHLTSVVIPDSVTEIESQAFMQCKQLSSVSILNPNIKIAYYAFHDCVGLKRFECPEGLSFADHEYELVFYEVDLDETEFVEIAVPDKSNDHDYKYSVNGQDYTTPRFPRSGARNKDKMTKANLMWDVVNTLVKEVKTDITMDVLLGNEFDTHGNATPTFVSKARYDEMSDKNKRRYFPDPISLNSGDVVYFSNQWGNNLDIMINAMKGYGIVIK